MEDVVVFAALAWEARAALDALQGVEVLGPRAWRGYLGDGAAVRVLQTGVGPERARRAAEQAPRARLFVSSGCSGALGGGLHAGDVVIGDRVVSLDGESRVVGEIRVDAAALAAWSAARGLAIRVASVASSPVMLTSPDARGRAARSGGCVVEMESAAVAVMARACGAACAIVKVVLDESSDDVALPSVIDVETGELAVARGIAAIALRPRSWPTMARLARQQRVAERRLREFLAVLFSAGLDAHGIGPQADAVAPSARLG